MNDIRSTAMKPAIAPAKPKSPQSAKALYGLADRSEDRSACVQRPMAFILMGANLWPF
jgi:hypothetical protein